MHKSPLFIRLLVISVLGFLSISLELNAQQTDETVKSIEEEGNPSAVLEDVSAEPVESGAGTPDIDRSPLLGCFPVATATMPLVDLQSTFSGRCDADRARHAAPRR